MRYWSFCSAKYDLCPVLHLRYCIKYGVIFAKLYNSKSYIFIQVRMLTHWGRVTHICVSELTIIGSDNGLSPGRRQAIIWTSAGILIIRTLGTNFSEDFSKIGGFSFKKMHLKMPAKWGRFCLRLNVLKVALDFILKGIFFPNNNHAAKYNMTLTQWRRAMQICVREISPQQNA